jgi:Uncharacterized protein conserved in bacteria
MKLIPFFAFQGQAHEAMAFYAQALGGQVVSETRYRDMPPGEDMGEGCGQPSRTPWTISPTASWKRAVRC